MDYKQDNIKIGDILLPEIKYKDDVYYPLTYVFKKVLLKNKQSVNALKKRGYEEYLTQFKVNFNFNNGGIHSTYCISKVGLIELLKTSNIGGLTVEQKKGMNSILEYFDLHLIDEEPRFLDNVNYENDNTYTEFEKDCIKETLKLDNNLQWQRCKNCGKYYPLYNNFFPLNNRGKNYGTICNTCIQNGDTTKIIHPDSILNHTFKTYGYQTYLDFKNHNVIGIYNHYLNANLSDYPKIINNKNDFLTIITYLYSSEKINKDEITITYLINEHKLKNITKYLRSNDIYKHLFGNHPWQYPWHYKNFKLSSRTIDEACIIFNNYLKEKDIQIEDIYNFDYYDIARKSRIGKSYYSDILAFVMRYYDDKYPAYKFNIASVNYWKKKENRVMALKYLIEEDMKLEIEKIPLYLTITSIRNIGTTTMYTVLKNYYSGLYEWVNEVYPNVFDPKDFDINYMRNEFDSIDEHTIDEILRDNFDNVLYNPKHNEHTVKLVGKIPDWFIFTTTGVIVVEYFGLWVKKRGMYNSRTRDYIISSKDKIEKYKTLQGYKFLYIFPEDLDNNYEGLYKKIEDVKNNKILSKTI